LPDLQVGGVARPVRLLLPPLGRGRVTITVVTVVVVFLVLVDGRALLGVHEHLLPQLGVQAVDQRFQLVLVIVIIVVVLVVVVVAAAVSVLVTCKRKTRSG
jgi:hypothetical protein